LLRSVLGFLAAVAAGDDDSGEAAASEKESDGARPNGRDASEVLWVVHTGVTEAARKLFRVGEREAVPPKGAVWIGGMVGGP
jgi:hypothetical protein